MSEIEERVSDLEDRMDKLEEKLDNSSKRISNKPTSINEFKQGYNYNSYADKAILIAYYLERYKEITEITSGDLLDWFKKCKWDSPSNPNDTVSDAASRHGYFACVGKEGQENLWMLTETGERYVEEELKKVD